MYGNLIADTKASMKYSPFVKVSPLPAVDTSFSLQNSFIKFVSLFSNLISKPLDLPLLHDTFFSFEDFPEVIMALKRRTEKTLRKDSKGKLYLSVAIPIKNIRMVRGMAFCFRKKIEQELVDLETELFKAFGLILLATLLLLFILEDQLQTQL